MHEDTKLFWASLDFLTIRRLKLLRKHFGDLETARKHFSRGELEKAGIEERGRESVWQKWKDLDWEKTQKVFEKTGATLLFFEDEPFPAALREIANAPIFLFCKGKLLPQDTISLAVVGTRKCSQHGLQAIAHLLPELVRAGFTIVSGMARGIDAAAHREALQKGGRTIAFIGTGIDMVYPAENRKLALEIEQNGAILSEFPLGTKANPFHFPRRNRLISGFSLGTLVIEGKEKSGSLITALLALEQGKEVFAVPGSPFAVGSAASNRLIQKGEAKLVENAQDILEEFSFLATHAAPVLQFTPENETEEQIFQHLSKQAMPFDELVRASGISSADLTASLTVLSLRGAVREIGADSWMRNF